MQTRADMYVCARRQHDFNLLLLPGRPMGPGRSHRPPLTPGTTTSSASAEDDNSLKRRCALPSPVRSHPALACVGPCSHSYSVCCAQVVAFGQPRRRPYSCRPYICRPHLRRTLSPPPPPPLPALLSSPPPRCHRRHLVLVHAGLVRGSCFPDCTHPPLSRVASCWTAVEFMCFRAGLPCVSGPF